MACPLWGDGSKWGDGDLWCRLFGSLPYVTEVDRQLRRCSVSIQYTGTSSMVIDRIHPNIDWGRSQQDYTYAAEIDRATGNRISIQVAYSSPQSFVIRRIIPQVQIKKHLPVG